jgi:glycosyltransferase involved in cell wall biosynthesis
MPGAAEAPPELTARMHSGIIALVGKRDEPTDAVRDYCGCLGRALGRRGAVMETVEVAWDRRGRLAALATLWKQSAAWRGRWVLLQYTALMWSRRGFPLWVPIMLAMLRRRGCRTGILFHDVCPHAGPRWIDKLRVSVQLWSVRRAHAQAERVLFSLPLSNVHWLPQPAHKAFFVPVGANVPSLDDRGQERGARPANNMPTVAVFGVSTWHAVQRQEIEAICHAMRSASAELGKLGLLVIGRGAREAESALRQGLHGSSVELTVDGVLSRQEIASRLSSGDVLLFVRGPLSSRRGSGLAGMACGLPILAYEGSETGPPLTEAGIVFVAQDDLCSLAQQLTTLLRDDAKRRVLSERNMLIFREWFSWERVADRLTAALGLVDADR